MNLKPYHEYNDSGVKWIGKIPLNWQADKFTNFIHLKHGHQFGEDDFTDYGLKIIKITQLKQNGVIDLDGCSFIDEDRLCQFKKYLLCEGDVLMALSGATVGKVAKINFPIENTLQNYRVGNFIPLRGLSKDFIYYILLSKSFNVQMNLFVVQTAQGNIGKKDFKQITIPIPPKNEQTEIVAFLDKKTSEIDLTIEKDTRLIELLKEKRTALINHVVTNGLDPTVKMKDSGVEWIGEIPEDWSMIKVKHLAGNCSNPVQTGPFGAQLHAEDYVETGIPLILIRNVNNGRINIKNIPFVSEEDAIRLSMYRLNMGDIVFSRVGSLGRAALVTKNEEGWLISGQMLRLRLQDKRINALYLVYVFQSDLSNEYVSLESVGSTRESLNTEILSNLPFPLPSNEKQRDIVEYLDNETLKIDLIIQKVENKIAYLEEYKKSLIHHVVTGKVDVREVAV